MARSDRTKKGGQLPDGTDFAVRLDESGTILYIGIALPGAAEADPVWQIKKVVEIGGSLTLTWADGNDYYDNVWDNRASLTYT